MRSSATRTSARQFDRGEIDAEGKPRFQGFDPRAGMGGAGGGPRRFRGIFLRLRPGGPVRARRAAGGRRGPTCSPTFSAAPFATAPRRRRPREGAGHRGGAVAGARGARRRRRAKRLTLPNGREVEVADSQGRRRRQDDPAEGPGPARPRRRAGRRPAADDPPAAASALRGRGRGLRATQPVALERRGAGRPGPGGDARRRRSN